MVAPRLDFAPAERLVGVGQVIFEPIPAFVHAVERANLDRLAHLDWLARFRVDELLLKLIDDELLPFCAGFFAHFVRLIHGNANPECL